MHQRAEIPARIGIGAGIDAGQHQFGESGLNRAAAVGEHFIKTAGAFRSPGVGDDAVGAEVVAPLLNLQKGAAAEGKPTGGVFRERFDRLIQTSADSSPLLPFAQKGFDRQHDLPLFRIGENEVGGAVGEKGRPVKFGTAAGDHDGRTPGLLTEFPDRLAAFARRLRRDCTAVDDDERSVPGGVDDLVAVGGEPGDQQGAVRRVEAAAERMNVSGFFQNQDSHFLRIR